MVGRFSRDRQPEVDQLVCHQPGEGGQLGVVGVSTPVVALNEGLASADNLADRHLKRKEEFLQWEACDNTINKVRWTITSDPSLKSET